MPDDRHDHDDLIGLGYDEHDIADRNLTIERDGDTEPREVRITLVEPPAPAETVGIDD